MRYKIIIEYCGTEFVGWQRQKDGLSIQQVLEEAISKSYRFIDAASPDIIITGAGRTDAGVHAYGQIAHFDVPIALEGKKFVDTVNFFMRPYQIKIVDIKQVEDAFHSRYSAIQRHYLYRIIIRQFPLELDAKRAWHMRESLDATLMHEASQHLLGLHDFSSFRAASCQANNAMRSIDKITVCKQEYEGFGEEVQIRVSAKSFLHHMVRNIVGSLVPVGKGDCSAKEFLEILKAKDRMVAGITAPACGLYFHHVDY